MVELQPFTLLNLKVVVDPQDPTGPKFLKHNINSVMITYYWCYYFILGKIKKNNANMKDILQEILCLL